MSDRILAILSDAETDFVMFSTTWCPYCVKAKRMLEGHSLSCNDINVEEFEGMRDEVVVLTGHRTVPVIFDTRGEEHIFVGGSDNLEGYL
ncbi:MAG: glutaredoxin [Candidatus Thalassarchaeaceae archaeon]|nr:glutaredoxin [Candidatus Thalassarchaeaceae archaeon]